ncbi:class I SAM-dependent methyltransferase [Actinocorallia lasiicapitis]
MPIRASLREFVSECRTKHGLKPPFLDVGAGYRTNEPEICGDGLVDYHTLDINPELAPDFVADAHDLSFLPEERFATVLCTELLEHTRNPFQVVEQMLRVLAPEGHLLASVPFAVPIHRKPPHQEDYWRFTPAGLLQLFAALRQVELRVVGDPAEPTGTFALFQKE